MTENVSLPTARDLLWPTILAMRALGGSGHIEEITEEVAHQQGFSEEQISLQRSPTDSRPALDYRLAWSRNGLKLFGAIVNSARGVWALTDNGRTWTEDQLKEARLAWEATYRKSYRKSTSAEDSADLDLDVSEHDVEETNWKDRLLEKLFTIEPSAFERLAQRILREAGFRNVEVTGRSGDGGIDGVGVYQLSLVSFPIYFQCKRYRGSVSSGAVRDFRGAMSGRGEKGLLITTGSFTPDAKKEASRDGAPPVELISGDGLCNLLKDYSLGVETIIRPIEDVQLDLEFFDEF
jgi:restriction system protein